MLFLLGLPIGYDIWIYDDAAAAEGFLRRAAPFPRILVDMTLTAFARL